MSLRQPYLMFAFLVGFRSQTARKGIGSTYIHSKERGAKSGRNYLGLIVKRLFVLADTLIKIFKLTVLIIECFLSKVTSATKVFFVIK